MREFGTLIITDPDAPVAEHHTVTCCHCQAVVVIKTGRAAADAGGYCRLCNAYTCGPCADTGTCVPFEVRLLRMEGRRAFLRGVDFKE
jgi:hypothetical protein